MRNGKILGIGIYLTFIFCSYFLWEKHVDPISEHDTVSCSQLSLGLMPLIWDNLLYKLITKIRSESNDCTEELILDCNNSNYQFVFNEWIDSLNLLIANPIDRIDINQINISELFNYCDNQISFEIVYSPEKSCQGVVKIEDNMGPEIDCDSTLILYTNDTSVQEKYADYLEQLPISDCTRFTYSSSINPNAFDITCFPDTLLSLSIYAIDNCGNRSSCTTSISVFDTLAVRLVCPNELIIECSDLDNVNELTSWFEAVKFSPIDAGHTELLTRTPLDLKFNDVCSFTQDVVWEGFDNCSEFLQCHSRVTIKDEIGPHLNCPDSIILNRTNLDNLASQLEVVLLPEISDACNDFTLNSYLKEPLIINVCDSIITKEVIVEAVDVCSNYTTCQSKLIIKRSIKPTLLCPDNLQIQCQEKDANEQLDVWINTAEALDYESNNLEINTKPNLLDIEIYGCDNNYQVTFYAVDDCAQRVDCVSNIKIIDSIPPVITCPPSLLLDLNEKSFETLIKEWEESLIVQEECNAIFIQSDFPALDNINKCQDSLIVEFYVSDACENLANCSSTVYLIQDYAISVECPDTWQFKCINYNDPDVFTNLYDAVEVSSNIPYELFWESENLNSNTDCVNAFSETFIFFAVDECDNEAHCSTIIEWQPKLNVYIPNIISRQATSPNNGFMIFSNQEDLLVEDLFIYNKWGNLMFEQHDFPTNNPKYKWEGIKGNNGSASTVFTYMVRIKDLYGEIIEYMGTISWIN